MATVKVSWSGGKDSTCAVDLHIEQGDTVKAVCYIPMFTKYIPMLLKPHYEFILRTADYFRKKGAEVYIVSGEAYLDHFLRRASMGKHKGRMFCFPPFWTGCCDFKRDSKEKALKSCDVGEYEFEDIGIAYDETARHSQINDKLRSILCEKQMTEADAYRYCEERGILSPHYARHKRDGCTLCPQAKADEREEWFREYPEARDLVIALQNICRRERPEQTPLRNHEWFIWQPEYENYQFTVEDYLGKEGDIR